MKKSLVCFAILFVVWVPLQAQEKIALWPKGFPEESYKGSTDSSYMLFFASHFTSGKAPTFLICPGGGYRHLSFEKEGTDVAHWLNGLGFHAVVLKYRLGATYLYPAPLHDALQAMEMIRKLGASKGIDTNRLGVIGFSAGGHLASMLSNANKAPELNPAIPVKPIQSAILIYPVISLEPSFGHQGSRIHLLGKRPADSLKAVSMSTFRWVNSSTPPTFIVHAVDDRSVPIENAWSYILSMRNAQIPIESLFLSRGGHGFGLGQKVPETRHWTPYAEAWLKKCFQ